MQRRGSYGFEITANGRVTSSIGNVELLRRLLLDWDIIGGRGGPGTRRGDGGAWHVFCHLAAAAGLFRREDGFGAWVGITFDPPVGTYRASVCCDGTTGVRAYPLESSEAEEVLRHSEWCGLVEGASRGHILDRAAEDPGDPEVDDRRQDYERDVHSDEDGGPVWEFWTVSRRVNESGSLGSALVGEYVALLSVLGGRFAGVVSRGRREFEYGHLAQLGALVTAGLIRREDALADVLPVAIPKDTERTLLEATPSGFAVSATSLAALTRRVSYFMFERKLASFMSSAQCARELCGTSVNAVGRCVTDREAL